MRWAPASPSRIDGIEISIWSSVKPPARIARATAATRAAANSQGSLEDAFLQLTGGNEYKEMLKYLS